MQVSNSCCAKNGFTLHAFPSRKGAEGNLHAGPLPHSSSVKVNPVQSELLFFFFFLNSSFSLQLLCCRCGKTTICQIFAALTNQKLYSVNCHLHMETSDFLGGLRPVRQRSKDQVCLASVLI